MSWDWAVEGGHATTIFGSSGVSGVVCHEDPIIAKATTIDTLYVYRYSSISSDSGRNDHVLFTHTNPLWQWKNNPWNERYEIPADRTIYVTSGDGIGYLDGTRYYCTGGTLGKGG